MDDQSTTAAIILAGGSSSRMGNGRHKLLLPLGERPVLAHTVDAVLASQAHPVIIVLGHQAGQVREALTTFETYAAITFIDNPVYQQGMSTSINAGIRVLMERPALIENALIVLGDQPLMTPMIIDTLIKTRRTAGKRIVAPLYEGTRGSPVLFSASLFPELLAITGDQGGRSVIERHRQEVEMVEVGSAQASYDVDTWEAYQQIVQAWEHTQES